ncbi:MAG: glycosyltransferase [Deltaproteobacteria bacterium]|nr:glycosyltransferase [Deltaproteobacteria bacterium]
MMTNAPTSMRRIVIVRRYGLGNFILALPLIEAARQAIPEAEVILFVDSRCASIAEMTCPDLRRAVYENPEQAAAWFADVRPDVVLFTYPTVDAALISAANASGAKTVCHNVPRRENPAVVRLAADPARTEAELNLDLLRAMGADAEFRPPRIDVTATGQAEAERALREHGVPDRFVALHPGCHGDWEAKRWPASSFARLIDMMAERGTHAVLLGGPDEVDVADDVMRHVTTGRIVNLAGRTSLAGAAGILARAVVMVSNDSGLMHLAAAVGAPVVALFGPTSWAKNPPLAGRSAIVRQPVACSPCFVMGGGRPRRAWCTEMLAPAKVLRALDALLVNESYVPAPPEKPFVSVVVPTRNRSAKLAPTIDSLLGQTYPRDRYEVIVVDNDSTDDTARVIQSYPHVRYEFVNHRHSSYAARNRGIAVARGEVLAFIDDDAVAHPDWLANGAEWFAHPQVGCVAGRTDALNPDSDVAHFQARSPHLFPGPEVETAEAYGVPTVNCFWRRETIEAIGPFNEELKSGGDFDLTFRLRKDGRWCVRFAEFAVVRHRHRESVQDLFRVFARYGYGSTYVAKTHHTRSVSARWSEARTEWSGLARRARGVLRERMSSHGRVVPTMHAREFIDENAVRVFSAHGGSPAKSAFPMSDAVQIPVAPNPDYLAAALDAIATQKPGGWYIYGAGQHTRRAAGLLDLGALGVAGIVDDDPAKWGRLGDLPIVGRESALSAGMKTIVVSSDYFESALLEKLRPLRRRGIDVCGLYDADAYERYGQAVASRHERDANRVLYVPRGTLDRAHRNALALGLGARAVIVDDGEAPGVYDDEFLDWVSRLAFRTGRLAGCVRYGYFAP